MFINAQEFLLLGLQRPNFRHLTINDQEIFIQNTIDLRVKQAKKSKIQIHNYQRPKLMCINAHRGCGLMPKFQSYPLLPNKPKGPPLVLEKGSGKRPNFQNLTVNDQEIFIQNTIDLRTKQAKKSKIWIHKCQCPKFILVNAQRGCALTPSVWAITGTPLDVPVIAVGIRTQKSKS